MVNVDKIKDLAKIKGISISFICEKLQRKPGYLNDLKRTGADLSDNRLTVIASILGTTTAYLRDETDDPSPPPIELDYEKYGLRPITTKKIPLLGSIACGEPIFAEQQYDLYFEADGSIKADFCLIAKGDSMTGARIFDGDIVFIRKQDIVENGEIAAVLIGDEATLKRIKYNKDAGELLLIPENPTFKIMHYFGEEINNIRVLGKAVAFQSIVR